MGDAVLNFVISDLLYKEFKEKNEGFLSKIRSEIVGRKHLNIVGKNIIKEKNIAHKLKIIPPNVYGNTLEALIAAIYLEKGLLETQRFVKDKVFRPRLWKTKEMRDYKSELLIITQKKNMKLEYKREEKEEKDHNKIYSVSLYLNDKKVSSFESKSIKHAEQKAARVAVENITKNENKT